MAEAMIDFEDTRMIVVRLMQSQPGVPLLTHENTKNLMKAISPAAVGRLGSP
jgi:hypothetical protein